MPGGLGKVDQAKKRVEEKRGSRRFLTIEDGETVIVRFLEEGQDFKDVYVHRVPFEGEKGNTYYSDVPCLDQKSKGTPCPGCRDDVELRYKFYANVIVRDYPETNDAGKVVGEKDQLMIWTGGVTVADKLGKKHKKYGLMSRDWEITREGVKKNTTYDVEQATEGAEPMSDADKAFMEKKNDLTWYVTPPDFEEFYVPPSERGKDEEDKEATKRGTKANPWSERKKKGGTKTRSMRTKSRSSRSSGDSGDDSSQKRRVRSGSSKKGTTKVRRRR